jgi:hypothetical protein
MKYLSLLALLSASSVFADNLLNKNFTVNLLTRDPSVSITNIAIPDQAPISFNDAPIKHVYDNNVYSVVGSMVFTEKNLGQKCHLDNDKWSVDVSYLSYNFERRSLLGRRNPSQRWCRDSLASGRRDWQGSI